MNKRRAKRKLSGILSADAMGYSRLMQEDEASTIRKLEESKEGVKSSFDLSQKFFIADNYVFRNS